jgi:DNA-binding transcriptional MerR regulator
MRAGVWKVGDLVKRTGLSIRTLHYYEEVGLLAPSCRTQAGHRLYGESDIIRLQHIMSLRQLGFSLDEIRDCLGSEDFSFERVIELHISRLKEQIETGRRLCNHLEAIAASLRLSGDVSVEELIQTIEEISMIEKYYTPEQLAGLKERREQIGEERIRQVEAEWQELMDEVRAEMNQGTDPASERVQRLAARWTGLVEEFTNNDPGIERAVGKMWQQEENIHGIDTRRMREMMEYISKASAARKQSE